MTISPNGIITVNRGDSFFLPIEINIGTGIEPEYYDLKDGDYLYFGLTEPNQYWEDAILKKRVDKKHEDYYGDHDFEFTTEDLELLIPGTYYYEVKLFMKEDPKTGRRKSEGVYTIISKRKFIIL